jgi:hypothetical protein
MNESRPYSRPKPFVPQIPARWAYRLHSLLAQNAVYRCLAKVLEWQPMFYRAFTTAEKATKESMFGFQMLASAHCPGQGMRVR